jgi:hypothetical protein
MAFRDYFEGKRVKILFDPKTKQIALQPTPYLDSYPTSCWRVWCSEFFRKYDISTQKVHGRWVEEECYLICTIECKP